MSKHMTRGNPRVAVAYLRASKNEQRLSGDAQRTAIEAWARREHIRVAVWCLDQGVRSVSPVPERSAFLALREHEAGVLVVAKRDRIARDVVLAACVERFFVSVTGSDRGFPPESGRVRRDRRRG